MLRASIGAGAAAWAAPVIIDSLTSPAGALSPCVKYYVKFTSAGACYNANPSCSSSTSSLTNNNTVGSSYTKICATSNPSSHPRFPTYTNDALTQNGITYDLIELKPGCEFSPAQTDFVVVGNYNFSTSKTCRALPPGGSSVTGPASGSVGIYQSGGRKAWIATSFGGQTLNYTYLEFCCIS